MLAHCQRVLTLSSIALSNFNHHTKLGNLDFILTIPGCGSCNSFTTFAWNFGEMIKRWSQSRQSCSVEILFLCKKECLSFGSSHSTTHPSWETLTNVNRILSLSCFSTYFLTRNYMTSHPHISNAKSVFHTGVFLTSSRETGQGIRINYVRR